MRRISLWVFLFLVTASNLFSEPANKVTIETSKGSVVVSVEVAESTAARAQGLMFRRYLAPDAGMLFVFPGPTQGSFWMKNTLLPLDIVFADATGQIVDILEQAVPFSEQLLTPKSPYVQVLEVNAGFVKRHRIAVGDRLSRSGGSHGR